MLNGAVAKLLAPSGPAEFRRCLEEVDVRGAMRIWAHVMPNMPQPKNEQEGLVMLHRARTEANSVMFKLRAYSHAWLCERSYPSGLPDHLRPRAHRIYPVIVSAVGIAVGAPPSRKEAALALRTAMSNTVLDAYAEGITDHTRIAQMMRTTRLNFKG